MNKTENVLRKLSDNESEGGYLFDMQEESDYGFFFPVVSSGSESDEDIKLNILKIKILKIRDGSQQSEFDSGSATVRLATQIILRGNSGPTRHAIINVYNDSALIAWLLFIDKTVQSL